MNQTICISIVAFFFFIKKKSKRIGFMRSTWECALELFVFQLSHICFSISLIKNYKTDVIMIIFSNLTKLAIYDLKILHKILQLVALMLHMKKFFCFDFVLLIRKINSFIMSIKVKIHKLKTF